MSKSLGLGQIGLTSALLLSSFIQPIGAQESAAAARSNGDDVMAERIVVTASPLARSADEFSKIVTTIDRSHLLTNGGASIGDALMTVPGISGTGFAPGANRPVIRGFDATRVLVTENGIGSLDVAEIGPDHGTPIDSLTANRIEVVRGAGTLRYGSQAIGGVVNVITDRIPDRLIDGWEGELAGIYGSAARGGEGAFQITGGEEGVSLHADAFLRNGGDYRTPDGRQANSFARTRGYSFGAARVLSNGSLGVAYTRYDAKYGLPAGDTFIDMGQDKIAARGAFDVRVGALQRVSVEAGYADYAHAEIEPGAGAASTFLNEEIDARAEAIFSAIGPARDAALGVQIQDRDFSALGEGADYLLPANSHGVAGYGFARFALGARVNLETSLRVEQAEREGMPLSGARVSQSFAPVSAAAGFVFDVAPETTIGLTATSAARVPALTELFAIGPHDGPATYEVGDPDLGLERANSLEATARYQSASGLQLNGALWHSWYDGFIFGALTGRTCDGAGVCIVGPGEELNELFYVQRDAQFWGFEAEARAALWSVAGNDVGVLAQADYVRGELDGGENVPRLTPFRYGAGFFIDGERVAGSIKFLRVEAQEDVAAFETRTPGYVDVSADITWRAFDDDAGALDIGLAVRNASDAEERNASSFIKDDVMMAGRDIRLIVRASF